MMTPPSPLNGQRISRIALAGIILAGVGIGLFIILWIVLGQAGLESVPRLIASMCIPPAVIAVILGIYMLFFRGSPTGS